MQLMGHTGSHGKKFKKSREKNQGKVDFFLEGRIFISSGKCKMSKKAQWLVCSPDGNDSNWV